MNKNTFAVLSALIGISSGALAAGSYTEDFNSYADNAASGFASGGQLLRSGTGSGAALVYNNSSSWKALRLIQDNTTSTTSSFVISGVEQSGQPINVINANFGLHLKNTGGLTGADIADRFSFNFGNVSTSAARSNEEGAWASGQTGNMLSIVWDFYDNDTGNGSGDANNNDRIGIEIYKNGSLLAGSFRTIQSSWVKTDLTGPFDAVSISWFKDTGNLDMSIAGTSVYSGFSLGGFDPGALDTRFSFAAATGSESLDIFVDDISINTVPEPSALSLLVLGLGGVIALRRRRG